MKIDRNNVTGFEFDHTDARGNVWECIADVSVDWTDNGLELDSLNNLIGRRDETFSEVAPDAGMIASLKTALKECEEIELHFRIEPPQRMCWPFKAPRFAC